MILEMGFFVIYERRYVNGNVDLKRGFLNLIKFSTATDGASTVFFEVIKRRSASSIRAEPGLCSAPEKLIGTDIDANVKSNVMGRSGERTGRFWICAGIGVFEIRLKGV